MQREYKISLSQEFYSDVVYLSQYDSDYDVIFKVMNKHSAVDVNGKSAKFTGTRKDGLGFTFEAVGIGSYVSFEINTSLTAVAGHHTAEIVFYDSQGLYFGSANVQVVVEPAARKNGTIDADTERAQEIAEEIQEIVDTAAATVKGEAEAWAVGQRDGVDVPSTDPAYENNAKFYAEQAAQIAEDISGVTGQVATNTSDISDLKEDLNAITSITYTTVDGYLDGNGNIQPQTPGTPKEVTTNRFKVVEGAKIHVDFAFTSNALMWIVYCCWNKNGTFLGRTYLVNSVLQKTYSGTMTVPNGATEIAFSWRTYSMATCTLAWAYSIYPEFYKVSADLVNNADSIYQLTGIESQTSIVHINVRSKTVNGVTFTVNESAGTVTADGTATAGAYIDIPFVPIKSGIYWLTGAPAGSVTSKWYQTITGGTAYETGNGASYPLTAGTLYNIRIVVQNGKTADNLVFTPRLVYRVKNLLRNNAARGQWLFATNPYYDHLFIETVGSSDASIPCQSIWHIPVSKRLGFDVIETNTQQTSDGKYVVMHGVSGKFGQAFYATNGDDISDTLVSDVTSDYVKTYVRFNSTYEKYRTAPSFVEEWLHEVKAHGLIPLIDCHFDSDLIGVVDGIMGNGNYIAYNADRSQTNATIMRYLSISSASMARFNCRKYEAPFMLCIANASSLTDAVLTEIIEACHAEGCYVGFAGSYESVLNNIRYINLGMDFCASNYQTPYNPNGNLINLCGDISFADFTTDGTEANSRLNLTDGQSVSAEYSSAVPLASASLEINFVGTLIINFGRFINNISYTSDGKKALRITTYFRNSVPTFSAESDGATTINSITFKLNKV